MLSQTVFCYTWWTDSGKRKPQGASSWNSGKQSMKVHVPVLKYRVPQIASDDQNRSVATVS